MEEQVTTYEKFAQTCHKDYESFIKTFNLNGTQPHYMQLIRDAVNSENYLLSINLQHVFSNNEKLYWNTIKYPDEVIPVVGDLVCEMASSEFTDKVDVIDKMMRV